MVQISYKTIFLSTILVLINCYSFAEETPKNQCLQFANQFLKEKKWGLIGKPNKKILMSASHNIKDFGAPIIKFISIDRFKDFKGKKKLIPGAEVESNFSSSDDPNQYDQWSLKFTDLKMKDFKNRTVNGEYERTYSFDTKGINCKLNSIKIQFKNINKKSDVLSLELDKSKCLQIIENKTNNQPNKEVFFQNTKDLENICLMAMPYFDNILDSPTQTTDSQSDEEPKKSE